VNLRKFVVLGVSAALAVSAFALAGCGGQETATEPTTSQQPAEELSGTIQIQGRTLCSSWHQRGPRHSWTHPARTSPLRAAAKQYRRYS